MNNKKIIRLLILVCIILCGVFVNSTYNSIKQKGDQMLNDVDTIVSEMSFDSYQYIAYSSHQYSNISKKATFAFLGGTKNVFDIECEETGFINVTVDKTLGDCKVIIVDRYSRNVICQLDTEGEMRVSLYAGIYDVIVVGDLFLGNVRVVLEEI